MSEYLSSLGKVPSRQAWSERDASEEEDTALDSLQSSYRDRQWKELRQQLEETQQWLDAEALNLSRSGLRSSLRNPGKVANIMHKPKDFKTSEHYNGFQEFISDSNHSSTSRIEEHKASSSMSSEISRSPKGPSTSGSSDSRILGEGSMPTKGVQISSLIDYPQDLLDRIPLDTPGIAAAEKSDENKHDAIDKEMLLDMSSKLKGIQDILKSIVSEKESAIAEREKQRKQAEAKIRTIRRNQARETRNLLSGAAKAIESVRDQGIRADHEEQIGHLLNEIRSLSESMTTQGELSDDNETEDDDAEWVVASGHSSTRLSSLSGSNKPLVKRKRKVKKRTAKKISATSKVQSYWTRPPGKDNKAAKPKSRRKSSRALGPVSIVSRKYKNNRDAYGGKLCTKEEFETHDTHLFQQLYGNSVFIINESEDELTSDETAPAEVSKRVTLPVSARKPPPAKSSGTSEMSWEMVSNPGSVASSSVYTDGASSVASGSSYGSSRSSSCVSSRSSASYASSIPTVRPESSVSKRSKNTSRPCSHCSPTKSAHSSRSRHSEKSSRSRRSSGSSRSSKSHKKSK